MLPGKRGRYSGSWNTVIEPGTVPRTPWHRSESCNGEVGEELLNNLPLPHRADLIDEVVKISKAFGNCNSSLINEKYHAFVADTFDIGP